MPSVRELDLDHRLRSREALHAVIVFGLLIQVTGCRGLSEWMTGRESAKATAKVCYTDEGPSRSHSETPPAKAGKTSLTSKTADRVSNKSSIEQTGFAEESAEPDAGQTSEPAGSQTAIEIEAPDHKRFFKSDPTGDDDLAADDSQQFVSLTLNQVVFACLNEHPTIAAALESIEQTRSDYLTSTLFPNPELFTDVQLLPLTRPFTVQKQGGPPQQDAILTYPIDWFLFGKRAAAMNTANHRVHVSEAEFQDLVRQRVLLATTSFYDALESQAIVRLARESTQNLLEVEKITAQAVDNGGRPGVELSRVRLDLLISQQIFRSSLAAYVGKEARLKAIVGQFRNGMRLRPAGDLGAELVPELPSVEAAISIAEEERPDLMAIRWRIAAEGTEIDLQRAKARPTVSPSVGYARQYQEKAIGFPDADSWSTSLTMSLPFYDRNQGNISKAMSSQRRAQWELQEARLNVQADVEEALADVTAAEQNARSVAEQQLILATRVRDSIVESYQLGGRPLLDVLDAQRNYRETNRLFITSRANYWRALFRFYAAIGRQPDNHE